MRRSGEWCFGARCCGARFQRWGGCSELGTRGCGGALCGLRIAGVWLFLHGVFPFMTHTHVCIRVCLKGVKRKVPSVSLKDIHNIQAHTWVGGRCVEGVAPLRSAVRKVTSPPALRLCAAAAAAPTHSTDTRLGGRARPAEQCTGAPLPRAPDSLHSRLRLRPASGTPRDLGKGTAWHRAQMTRAAGDAFCSCETHPSKSGGPWKRSKRPIYCICLVINI